MFARSKMFWLIVALGVFLGGVVPSSVGAQVCNEDGTICVEDGPYVTPASFQILVPADTEIVEVQTDRVEQTRKVRQGQWMTSIAPVSQDILQPLSVRIDGDGFTEFAEFRVKLLAAAVNLKTTLRRAGRWFVARTSYNARTQVHAEFELDLESKDGNSIRLPKHKVRKMDTPAGRTVNVLKISRKFVRRTCRYRLQCQVSAFSRLSLNTPRPNDGRNFFTENAFARVKGPLIG